MVWMFFGLCIVKKKESTTTESLSFPFLSIFLLLILVNENAKIAVQQPTPSKYEPQNNYIGHDLDSRLEIGWVCFKMFIDI